MQPRFKSCCCVYKVLGPATCVNSVEWAQTETPASWTCIDSGPSPAAAAAWQTAGWMCMHLLITACCLSLTTPTKPHCVSKNDTGIAHYNFEADQPILIIFGRDVPERAVIVWRFRGNIIRAALCWIVWHNIHSPQHTYVISSYRSNRLGLSHWDPYAVHRGGCLELYYCIMVEWFWWDSRLIFDNQLVSFSALTLLVWSSNL